MIGLDAVGIYVTTLTSLHVKTVTVAIYVIILKNPPVRIVTAVILIVLMTYMR